MHLPSNHSFLQHSSTKKARSPGFSAAEGKGDRDQFYASLLGHIPGAVYRCVCCDSSWFLEYISQGIEQISGYPATEFVNAPVSHFKTLVHPDDRASTQQAVQQAIAQQTPYCIDYRIRRADGQISWVREKGKAIFNSLGHISSLDGIVLDLGDMVPDRPTNSSSIFSPLPASIQLDVLENITDGFLSLDKNCQLTYLNHRGEQLLGQSRNELLGKNLIHELDSPTVENFFGELARALTRQKPVTFEACYSYEQRWLEVRGFPHSEGIWVFLRDITERKEALANRRHRDGLYRTLIKNYPNGSVLLFDKALRYTVAAGKELEALGFSKSAIEGKTLWEVFSEEHCQILEPLYRGALVGEAKVTELAYGDRIYLVHILPVKNETGAVFAGMVMTQNITECKIAEAENRRLIASLQESEAKTRSMASLLAEAQKLAHVGCWEFDVTTEAITWSDEVFRIFGLDTTQEPPSYGEYLARIHPEDRAVSEEAIARSLREGQPYELEQRIVQPSGSIRYLSANGEPIFNEQGQVIKLLGSMLDITDRHLAQEALRQSETQLELRAKELEAMVHKLQHTQSQLIQTERMSGLGQMVAGIAHEVNNPVSFIYGNIVHANSYIEDLVHLVNLYQEYYPQPVPEIAEEIDAIDLEFLFEDLPKLLKSMKSGAERIREIVRSLRNFSRLDEAEIKPVNIHEGIDSTLLILQNRLRGNEGENGGKTPSIEVIKEYGDLPPVDCYPGQLNQVFLNIINNAIDALQRKNPPRIIRIHTRVIEASEVKLPADSQQTGEEESTGDRDIEWVEIRIVDNGPGIPEEVRQKMFDPFFTTKPVGTGTGVGLSISYQIVVEKHKGRLTCFSEPGQDTQLLIQLPRHQEYCEPALFES